jgi:hypothetical protein
MRSLLTNLIALALAVALPAGAADESAPVKQDPEILRFASRALAFYPNSTFTIRSDRQFKTASGSYRIVEVKRDCASPFLSGISTLVVDEPARAVWIASVSELPLAGTNSSATALRQFVSDALPKAMERNMRIRTTVDWEVDRSDATTLVPYDLVVQSGYGEYRKTGAVTLNGGHLLLGARFSLDEDPVETRRKLFAGSEAVIWDRAPGEASVQIVEFSDLECPACRMKWPLIKAAVEKSEGAAVHGMVHFPLPTIHPWAFRAASAAWCVAAQDTSRQSAFKESFYSMQGIMEVDLVTPTAKDFVAADGLDEASFDACYLKDVSIDGIHAQMDLGNRLGINSTPTYFVNGWLVQAPDASWFGAMVDSIAATGEPFGL